MILTLPPKATILVDHYLHLRIGNQLIQCPYYQNITRKRSKPVFVGKGLPEEIEKETVKLINKVGKKDINLYRPEVIRYTMLMAGLGIDCSGLATRVLDSLLEEKEVGKIKNAIKKPNNLVGQLRNRFKLYTNISADQLTSDINCFPITNINKTIPGDLIRFGKRHVAIIIKVEKDHNKIKLISYCHSTSDYFEQYGVRVGQIIILNNGGSLEDQKWTESYRGQNYTFKDYLKSDPDDRGLRRLRILANTTS